MRHRDVWQAIDRLAAEYGMSPSGLARKAGLDPTTFNKSKRVGVNGKQRWPSTESVSKVLRATGASLDEFLSYVKGDNAPRVVLRIPVIGHAQAGESGFFDDAGYPTGTGWDEVTFPDIGDPHAYALEIAGDSMEPVYRDGDTIVVSPEAGIRRGDRVVVKTTEGEVMVKELTRQTARKVELRSLNPAHGDRSLDTDHTVFVHRVLWASQ